MNIEHINILLQEVADQLKARQVEIDTEQLMQEIAFLTWVGEMEKLHGAYSYCEE